MGVSISCVVKMSGSAGFFFLAEGNGYWQLSPQTQRTSTLPGDFALVK